MEYLKILMQSKDMSCLWDITDPKLNDKINSYIVRNGENEMVGYLNLSNPTESFYGNTIVCIMQLRNLKEEEDMVEI